MKDKVSIELSVSDAQALCADLILFKNTANGVNDIPDHVISVVEATGVLETTNLKHYFKLLSHATLDVSLTKLKDDALFAKAAILAMNSLDSNNEGLRHEALNYIDRIFK